MTTDKEGEDYRMDASAANGAAETSSLRLSKGNFHVAKGPDWARHPDLIPASPSDRTPNELDPTVGNNVFALG
jgi:hypothetical protein